MAWACALLLLALLRGLRRPNCWSATLAQLNYSDGLIKRGLFGSTMRALGVPIHRYQVFALVAYLGLGLWLTLLALLIARCGLLRSDRRPLTFLVLGSFALTYLGHLIGYLDIVLLALATFALWVQRPWLQLAAAAFAGVVGVFTHELYVLTCLPVTLLPAWLQACGAQTRQSRIAWIAAALGVAMGGLVLACLLSMGASLSPHQLTTLRETLKHSTDFAVRDDALDVLARSLQDNVALVRSVAGERWFKDALVSAALEFVPTALLLVLAASLTLASTWAGMRARVAIAAVTLIVFGPLALVVIGWDVHRWGALCVVNAFLGYAVVTRHVPGVLATARRRWISHAAWSLLALNLISADGFMDHLRPEAFPFRDHYYAVRAVIRSGAITPPER